MKPAWHAIRITMLYALVMFEKEIKGTPNDQVDAMAEKWLTMDISQLEDELIARGCPINKGYLTP